MLADVLPGPSFALIRPQAISLHSIDHADAGSAQNRWPGTVTDIERIGDRVRVHIDGLLPLTAEITTVALNALELRPGDPVLAVAKATDIEAYPV